MSVAELRELEEVKGLITRGLQVGVLTYAEIAAATAAVGLEETDFEELHGLLERCEIELVEEIDPATAVSLNINRAPEKRTRRKAALDLKPEGTTDALQLFLKDIGTTIDAGPMARGAQTRLRHRLASYADRSGSGISWHSSRQRSSTCRRFAAARAILAHISPTSARSPLTLRRSRPPRTERVRELRSPNPLRRASAFRAEGPLTEIAPRTDPFGKAMALAPTGGRDAVALAIVGVLRRVAICVLRVLQRSINLHLK